MSLIITSKCWNVRDIAKKIYVKPVLWKFLKYFWEKFEKTKINHVHGSEDSIF